MGGVQRNGQSTGVTGVLAMNKTMAARMLGVSVDFFDAHIAGEIKSVRRGRRRLYVTQDLHRWLEDNAEVARY